MKNLSLEAIDLAIQPMLNSRLRNYIIPGLTSQLVGGGEYGKVRLFSAERNARDFVTPHSHRFDFTCLVLAGRVHNTLFIEHGSQSEEWCASTIGQVCGKDGLLQYVHTRDDKPGWWAQETYTYDVGSTYSMKSRDIHSIRFETGSRVLFFEGPSLVAESRMLEPWVGGKVVPTFKTEPWMFERDAPTVPHG